MNWLAMTQLIITKHINVQFVNVDRHSVFNDHPSENKFRSYTISINYIIRVILRVYYIHIQLFDL